MRECVGCNIVAFLGRAALVPVFSFGENDTYQQVMFADGSWCRWLQKRLQKIVGFALCVIQGCSLLSADTWGVMPFPKPITSVGETRQSFTRACSYSLKHRWASDLKCVTVCLNIFVVKLRDTLTNKCNFIKVTD